MQVRKHLRLCLFLLLLTGSLSACNGLPAITNANGTPIPIITTSHPNSSSATPTLNTWYPASSGIEVRYEHWKSPGNNEDTVTIVRLDPQHIHLSIGYQPNQPMGLRDWMQQEQAKVIINGGYFDQQNNATALLVSNGQVSGSSYNGFGGMLSVDSNGTISLRSLRNQPYDPNTEQLQQATQSSPMLMIDGQRTQFSANAASQRRTVVATDTKGRLLFIISPGEAFTLDELADLLVSSDLSLKNALNLDGGASTGLYMNAGGQQVAIDSISALPIVIIVK